MSEATERLERFVAACCEGSADERLATLEAVSDRASTGVGGDVATLSALASDTRYRLVRALVEARREGVGAEEPGELCVCELRPLFPVSESAVSHALSTLREAGLVRARDDGKWRYYAPTDRAVALVETLEEVRE